MKNAFYDLAKNIEKRYHVRSPVSTLVEIFWIWAILMLLYHMGIVS